jgi:hypothetical protein
MPDPTTITLTYSDGTAELTLAEWLDAVEDNFDFKSASLPWTTAWDNIHDSDFFTPPAPPPEAPPPGPGPA